MAHSPHMRILHYEQEAKAAAVLTDKVPRRRLILDLSTSHLPEHLGTDLNAHDAVVAYNLEYGWLMWVPDDPVVDDDDPMGRVPSEVLLIQLYARRWGCDYVLFDADGPVDPNLPAWEW